MIQFKIIYRKGLKVLVVERDLFYASPSSIEERSSVLAAGESSAVCEDLTDFLRAPASHERSHETQSILVEVALLINKLEYLNLPSTRILLHKYSLSFHFCAVRYRLQALCTVFKQ